jgi:hypothetical protein
MVFVGATESSTAQPTRAPVKASESAIQFTYRMRSSIRKIPSNDVPVLSIARQFSAPDRTSQILQGENFRSAGSVATRRSLFDHVGSARSLG